MRRAGMFPILMAGLLIASTPVSAAPPAPPLDARLDQKVTLALKGTALAALCERLSADTGIAFAAGASVADEKVTLFCRERPVREVMRQLDRPFGYSWLRSTVSAQRSRLDAQRSTPDRSEPGTEHQAPGTAYRYELVQDLRSQLVEEELRRRDRDAAFLALDREMQRYRRYLNLSPDEALARAAGAPPEEKKLLEQLANAGRGPMQLYFRLSPDELAALRSGQVLVFTSGPQPGARRLPAELERGVLQSMRQRRVTIGPGSFKTGTATTLPDGLPPVAAPDARPIVALRLGQSEIGQFGIAGSAGFVVGDGGSVLSTWQESLATLPIHFTGAVSGSGSETGAGAITSLPLARSEPRAPRSPDSAVADTRLARDTALRPRVTVRPRASCGSEKAQEGPSVSEPKATTADVLEVLHRATGMPIAADYYTWLYPPAEVSVADVSLFDALNRLADAMRLQWKKEGDWLQFRSVRYYDDRLQEVPNRLLERWSEARRQRGALALDEVIEIAGLADAQLDAAAVAEGARLCWGLAEWDLARSRDLRPHLRYLAGFTPSQREQAASAAGLPFPQMSLAQQQSFLTLALGATAARAKLTLADLATGTLRVEYTVPGWFQWTAPRPSGAPGTPAAPTQAVRERTREAALQAARRLDPRATAAQILPTALDLKIIYTIGVSETRLIRRTVTPTGGGRRTRWQ